MKIGWIKGNKGEKDRIITFTSDGENEWFSIFKLSLLANQLAINELNINGDSIKATGRFFLKEAIIETIKLAEEGIDFAEDKNKDFVIKWCLDHKISFEKIESELRKIIQKRVEDFEE